MKEGSASATRRWNIIELLRWGTTYLADKGIDESRLTMELLLAHVLGCRRIALYTNFEKPVDAPELATLRGLLQRRLNHEPLQYIIGEAEFMGLTFAVDPSVLIPRPETELVAERAIALCRARLADSGACRLLDVGTGSGCIAVSCARLASGTAVTAIDASAAALSVARRNADRNGVASAIQFEAADITQRDSEIPGSPFDILAANPPYISLQEYERLAPELRNFEPREALCDGGDGLSFYRALAERSAGILSHEGKIVVEHAYDQSDAVVKIFGEKGWRVDEQFRDYGGNPRGAIFSRG